jgi:acyl-CoA thioester hydrolase
MSDPLEGFPVVIEAPVAWGEMDAFQHVNNIFYFRYFESARIAYFERCGALAIMEATGIGPILAAARCRFRIPLTYPDTVAVGARVPAVGRDRFTMAYAAVSRRHGKLAAEGEGEIVAYDYRAGHKTDVPDALRRRIAELEAPGQR